MLLPEFVTQTSAILTTRGQPSLSHEAELSRFLSLSSQGSSRSFSFYVSSSQLLISEYIILKSLKRSSASKLFLLLFDSWVQMGKNKKQVGEKSSDKDNEAFISRSRELKEEGNKLFQRRKYKGALNKYEEAIKFLPENHIEVCCLRSKTAACYMQERRYKGHPGALHECNLALKVNPKYSKALLNKAWCYEALNSLNHALRHVSTVLRMEPDNKMALEIFEKVKIKLEEKGLRLNVADILSSDHAGPCVSPEAKKDKKSKKGAEKPAEEKLNDSVEQKKAVNKSKEKVVAKEKISEKKADTKEVFEEKFNGRKEAAAKKRVKLVYGEDIRFAELQVNCSLQHLREVISNRFPKQGAVLVKYKDQEGDLVTITSDEELRWAETSAGSESYMRLYIVKTDPEQDPLFEK